MRIRCVCVTRRRCCRRLRRSICRRCRCRRCRCRRCRCRRCRCRRRCCRCCCRRLCCCVHVPVVCVRIARSHRSKTETSSVARRVSIRRSRRGSAGTHHRARRRYRCAWAEDQWRVSGVANDRPMNERGAVPAAAPGSEDEETIKSHAAAAARVTIIFVIVVVVILLKVLLTYIEIMKRCIVCTPRCFYSYTRFCSTHRWRVFQVIASPRSWA